MIDSLFILTGGGSFVVEKHLKGKHSREVLDAFFSSLKDHEPADVPKAIRASSSTALLHIYRNDLFYLAVVSAEVCPLAVFDLLSRFYGVLQRYIGTPTDDSLRAHFSTSYLLMDEMMDSGFPFTTDLNQLEAIIAPPTTLNKVVSVVAGGSTQAIRNENELDPVSRLVSAVSGQPHTPTSSTPSQGIWWRRSNVTYASNEVYADVIERIDCILDSTGNVAMGGIAGEIQVNAKLSGASPECRLTIRNADIVKHASFHPCVRVKKFREQNVLSFIPPDGTFTLCAYWLRDTMQNFPVTIQGGLTFHEGMGKLKLSIQPRLSVFIKNPVFVDRCQVSFQLPGNIIGCDLNATAGQWKFYNSTSMLQWTLGKLPDSSSVLEGTLAYYRDENGELRGPEEEKCTCQVFFSVKGWVMSGFKLDSLDVTNVTYTPYKGCRYSSKSGKVEVRLV
eukprot:GEMP01043327.1.p1 GENE.GEMP01043327.1~~GEMP01043327.1.p1  ORF type:complete len:448 (-),score=85.44 GEMP01043327.1:468-1811(-)